MGPHPTVAAVRLAIRRALTDVPDRVVVLAACSGGADSLALAAGLAFEARTRGWRAGAVVVDHGLQADSGAVARRAAVALVRMRLDPVEVVSVRVEPRGGPEAAARAARYVALDAAAERHHAAAVLLGHTLDDQAESVVLGLARGSGARSLAGMPEVSGRYRRPLLGLTRATTVAACLAQGLTPWDDPHNTDATFARVRVRHDVLPTWEKALGPGVAEALARSARLLRADADALDTWAGQAWRTCHDGDGLVVERIAEFPAAVRTRMLRRLALDAGCPATNLTAAHVAELDRLVTDWHGQRWVELPGGRRAARVQGHIRVRAETPESSHKM